MAFTTHYGVPLNSMLPMVRSKIDQHIRRIMSLRSGSIESPYYRVEEILFINQADCLGFSYW